MQRFFAARVHEHKNILDQTTMRLDVVRKLCQCPAKAGDIVDQHIAPSGLHYTFKRRPGDQSLHGVCTGMVHLGRLDDVLVCHSPADDCGYFGQYLRNGVVAAGFLCMRGNKDAIGSKALTFFINVGNSKVTHQIQGRMYITRFGFDICSVLLDCLVGIKQMQGADSIRHWYGSNVGVHGVVARKATATECCILPAK